MFLNANFRSRIHARQQVAGWVWQIDFREHRFRFIERTRIACDRSVEMPARQFIDGDAHRQTIFDPRNFGSGTAICTRTVEESTMVTMAAFCGTLPEVAAGMNAPGSTNRCVTTPENGAVIFVKPSNVSARSNPALAARNFALAASTDCKTIKSGAFCCAFAVRL